MKYAQNEINEALEYLRANLPVGSTVYTSVRSVAKSGMSRTMKVYMVKDGKIISLNWYVCRALGESMRKDGTIRVHVCGMDAGFHLVYTLSRILYPEGFVVEESRHAASLGAAVGAEQDGGYALRQAWL